MAVAYADGGGDDDGGGVTEEATDNAIHPPEW